MERVRLNKKQIQRIYDVYFFEDWERIEQAEFDREKNMLYVTYFDKKDSTTATYEPNISEPEDTAKIFYILEGKEWK